MEGCREQFPSLGGSSILCDGAAGSQVPRVVIDRMAAHLATLGSTNIGGDYPTSRAVLDTVTAARAAAATLLGAPSTGEVAFGQNCTNLMFHLARAVEHSGTVARGDNIVLSRACHDANIAPWLLLAERCGLEVRWLEVRGGEDDATMDQLCPDVVEDLVDANTRLVSMGLASNATGRVHTSTLERVREVAGGLEERPLLVLDLTHFVPHRRADLRELGADAVICSAYKFFGPHLGLMAFDRARLGDLKPSKVGLRFDGGERRDLLDYGEVPDHDNCEISRWELGTLNYEALAGLAACVEYLAGLAPPAGPPCLAAAYREVRRHEERLAARFLEGLQPLLAEGRVRLLGSREVGDRTPTFALAMPDTRDPLALVTGLNAAGVACTHGNHYAVCLVDEVLAPAGVTRISLMHYNTLQEVDTVLGIVTDICQ